MEIMNMPVSMNSVVSYFFFDNNIFIKPLYIYSYIIDIKNEKQI